MKHSISILIVYLLMVATGLGQTNSGGAKSTAPAKEGVRVDYARKLSLNLKPSRQIVYKKIGDAELQLHIFEPQGFKTTDRRACFLAIHGGGWNGGEPRVMYPLADHFARLGMVGISVQYRLYNPKAQVTVFDCVKDGRSAVRYVRSHAAELGIDPQKIVVAGGSAGGHVAASTALFEGLDEAGEDTSVSCLPNALVLNYAVIDTSTEGYGNAKIGDRWHTLSPVHHVRAGLPPTLMFHGTGDTVTPFKGAKAFHEAMLKAGNRSELVIKEGGAHGYLMMTKDHYDEAMKKTEEFLASLNLVPATR
jgi:acetyl esterase/lipase